MDLLWTMKTQDFDAIANKRNASINVDVSVVILNWRSREFLDKCLETVIEYTSGVNFELIVIDNASYDGSAFLVRNKYPNALFIQNETNVGFSAGNNLGYEHAKGNVLLFLNPDTLFFCNVIKSLFERITSDHNIGVIGPRVLNSDKTFQSSSVQKFPTIFSELFDNRVFARYRAWKYTRLGRSFISVDSISGACMMIRREVFEKIGKFSTDYFMYSEDVDLCYKAKLAGYRVEMMNESDIIHFGGGSSGQEDSRLSTVMIKDSIYRFFLKYKGKGYAETYKSIIGYVSVLRISMLKILLLIRLNNYRRSMALEKSLKKWKDIYNWAKGKDLWVKRYYTN